MKRAPDAFPRFARWIADSCGTHSDAIVRDAPKIVQDLFELETLFPSRYGWRYRTDEAFSANLRTLKSAKEVNHFYWIDQSANVEAHAYMCVLRACELLKPAVRSLNIKEVIAPAILARSLLELATTFVVNVTLVDGIIRKAQFPPDTVVTSPEFEKALIRMIWGTRLNDPPPHLKQSNILTSIQKVSKDSRAANLLPTYEYLCELAHPNVMGNARFWAGVDAPHSDGSMRVVIEKYPKQTDVVNEITDRILWSLGWSAACILNAFAANRTALRLLFSKLGVPSQDQERFPD